MDGDTNSVGATPGGDGPAGLLEALVALQGAATVAAIGEVVTAAIGPALGAMYAIAMLVDERDRDMLRPAGPLPPALRARYERLSRRSKVPAVEAALGAEVWIDDPADLEAHQPRLSKAELDGPARAWAALPLRASADGRPLGSLALWFATARSRGGNDRAAVRAVAHHVGAALARVAASEELHRRIRFASDLTAAVVHDARSPLNAIVLCGDALGQSDDAPPAVRRLRNGAARLGRVLEHAGALVTLCLEGEPTLSPRAVDLRVLMTPLVAELGALASVPVTLEIVGDPSGTWDPRLQLAIAGLFDVVLHRGGGPLRVAIDGSSPRTVEISIVSPGELPSTLAATLAQPTVADWSPRTPGAGLALHVARLLARLHGGHLTAERAEGGARYTMTLPRAAS